VLEEGRTNVLGQRELPTQGYRSKSWDEFAAGGAPEVCTT
jgi:hypothetical protein